jgi:hypothetical protein
MAFVTWLTEPRNEMELCCAGLCGPLSAFWSVVPDCHWSDQLPDDLGTSITLPSLALTFCFWTGLPPVTGQSHGTSVNVVAVGSRGGSPKHHQHRWVQVTWMSVPDMKLPSQTDKNCICFNSPIWHIAVKLSADKHRIIHVSCFDQSGMPATSFERSKQSFRCGNSVSIVTSYGLDDRGSIPGRCVDGIFSLRHLCVQTGFGAHKASHPVGTGGLFLRGKVAAAWS